MATGAINSSDGIISIFGNCWKDHLSPPNIKSTVWSADEDDKLLRFYQELSANSNDSSLWSCISKRFRGKKSSSECRRRLLALSQAPKEDGGSAVWTLEQDAVLMMRFSHLLHQRLNPTVPEGSEEFLTHYHQVSATVLKDFYELLVASGSFPNELSNKSAAQCREQIELLLSEDVMKVPSSAPFSSSEDEALLAAVGPYSKTALVHIDWRKIALETFKSLRSPSQCKMRYDYLSSPAGDAMGTFIWTAERDSLLMAIVTSDVDDEYNWTEVSRKFAKDLNDPIAPTPRNCLERYLALLTETIDTDKKVCVKTEVGSGLEWTDDEDKIIIDTHELFLSTLKRDSTRLGGTFQKYLQPDWTATLTRLQPARTAMQCAQRCCFLIDQHLQLKDYYEEDLLKRPYYFNNVYFEHSKVVEDEEGDDFSAISAEKRISKRPRIEASESSKDSVTVSGPPATVVKATAKRGPWDKQEDAILLNAIKPYLTSVPQLSQEVVIPWSKIAGSFEGTRTKLSCAKRYSELVKMQQEKMDLTTA